MIDELIDGSSVLVVVATLNEEQGIGPTLIEIKSRLEKPFCLVVDGHSTDNTVRIARAVGAKVIAQRGQGKGDAIAAAVAYCGSLKVKYVALTDADFTYPADYLEGMINVLEKNPQIGMVCGNRFTSSITLEAMRSMFYLGNRMLAFIHNLLNGVNLEDPLTGLRVIRAEIFKTWKPKSKGFDIEVELNHYVERTGYGIVETPISYRTRLGEKKLGPKHGFIILKRILAESTTPVKSSIEMPYSTQVADLPKHTNIHHGR